MYQMMTPGPTMPAASVMEARSRAFANPDVDETFCEEYHQVCKDLSNLLGTDNETYVLGGEGILALEAACATLTEPGDKVLVIDNGIFGRGFADFVFVPKHEYVNIYPALLVELKWNQSAETAIAQIKERKYPSALESYTGKILLVGINYDVKTKEHQCRIEEYQC